MNNNSEPGIGRRRYPREPEPYATQAEAAEDFWDRLEVSLEFIRDGGDDRCLRGMIGEYDGLAERLEFDMSRDVTRWAMWAHAVTLTATAAP